jgi:co-chaperonin GroES (HSP10)
MTKIQGTSQTMSNKGNQHSLANYIGKEKPLMGEIVAIGLGRTTETGAYVKTTLEVGLTVVFPSFGGTKITVDGDEYVVMKETDLIAVIEKTTTNE